MTACIIYSFWRGRQVKLKFTYLQKVISSSKWLLKWSTEMGYVTQNFQFAGMKLKNSWTLRVYLFLSFLSFPFFFTNLVKLLQEKKENVQISSIVPPVVTPLLLTIYYSSKKEKKKIYYIDNKFIIILIILLYWLILRKIDCTFSPPPQFNK